MARTIRARGAVLAAVAVGGAVSATMACWAQDASGPAPSSMEPRAEPAPAAADAGDEGPVQVRFSFKGATFDQVIDFFSRVTGLPVVKETDVPQGTLDYLAPEAYTVPEALEILNIILQARGVMLRASDDMLYLRKLEDVQREHLPTFVEEVPADVRPSEIITVVRPLNVASAEPLAEKLKVLVAPYGAVNGLAQQNALVITETAAQVRRLLTIVEELDREDPEDAVEIFRIRHARAKDLMEPLKALLSKRIERFVPNPQQQGQMMKVEEQVMPGLNISFDDRTNTLIAKGVQTRLNKVRETLALLDVPDVGTGRLVRTFGLARVAPRDALARLEQLYARLPEAERPTLLPLDETGRITVVGSQKSVAEAEALLRELDGGDLQSPEPPRTIASLALQHAAPDAVAAAARALLNGRQLATTKMLPGPDGKSLLVAALPGDVAAVEALVPVLDRPGTVDRQVRIVRLAVEQPDAAVSRARELYEKQVDAADPRYRIDLDLDAGSRTLTMIGPAAAIERFAESLRLAETSAVVDRETRRIELAHATPSQLAGPLAALAAQVLRPADGGPYAAPAIEALDPLHALIVTALPGQWGVLDPLIRTLDRPGPEDLAFRVISLAGADAPLLVEKSRDVYERLSAASNPRDWPPPSVEFDPLTGNLVVSGRAEAVAAYERAVAEARRLLPPARTGRLIDLAHAPARDVHQGLRDLLATASPVDPARTVPAPEITVVDRTNGLYVVAEPAQHEMIERYVRTLDAARPAELPPLKLLQVRTVEAPRLAGLLRERYGSRPVEERLARPVEVDADGATNTLIVTAPPEVFQEIRGLVEDVNRAGREESDRETMLFPLKRARAADLAAALERLYPDPPMPLDRSGRPLPHLREPREVTVSAEAATNTLIVEAPAGRREQFEALVEQLDRVQLPPQAELRTYHIERGEAVHIAATLSDLARRGVLNAPPQEGTKPVEVIVQAEPVSRTLIVAGDATTFREVERMLADLQAVPVKRTLRVFDVERAEPQAIADRALRLYREQTAEVPGAGEVSVEVDRENGVILVVADDEAMVRFAGILDELRATVGPPPEVRLLALEYAEASEVVEFLSDLVSSSRVAGYEGPVPVFEPIERTNSVLVAARPELHEIVRGLVQGLDRPGAESVPPLRILQLRSADAMNLADALQRQYNQRHPDARKEKPVSVTADPNTNALIVAAHPEVLPEIRAIVEGLNEADLYGAGGREIRIFPLKVARAEELARTIDEMFPPPPVPRDRRGQPMPHLQGPREVVVRADPQTNSLLVDAPLARMAHFETLVEQLDRQDVDAGTEVRTYKVVHADLEALAGTLRELASAGTLSPSGADRRTPTSISTEPASRSLVVAGAADVFERVEGVLADLDAPRAGPATALRFFKLENARADTLVPMLRQVLLTRLVEEIAEAGAEADSLLAISADRKTNTLIVSAPTAIMPVAESIVSELDHPRAEVDVLDVRIFPLARAQAAAVADAVRTAVTAQAASEGIEPPMTIAAEPSSNSVVVTAPPLQMQRAEALIASLDGAIPAEQVQVRTVFLRHARAEHVAPLVEKLLAEEDLLDLSDLPSWARVSFYQARMQQGGARPRVRVAADQRLNAVVVSAPTMILNIAEQMVAQLDVEPGGPAAARRSVRVLVVENADARELAANLEEVFREGDQAEAPPTIRVDGPSNTLLVVAGDRQHETIEQVVRGVDRATVAASRQMRVIPIDPAAASAEELARTLRRILGRRGAGGVEVITVEELLNRPGKAREESRQDFRFPFPPPVERGRPPIPLEREIGSLLLAALPQADGDDQAGDADRDADDDGAGLTIAVDPQTNRLIVIGAPRAIDRVAELARQLLEQIPAAPGTVRYIALPPAADAQALSRLVAQTLAQLAPAGGQPGDLARRVAVLADPGNNALIVAANDVDFEVVGDLVAALSRPTTTERLVVKVYPLETITADRAAQSVRQLLDPGDPRPGRQAQRMRDLAVTLMAGDRSIEGVFDPARVRVASDPGANALVVTGPPEAVGFIDRFVELLDQRPVNVRATLKLYPLQHAQAPELTGMLREIFRTRYQSVRGTLGPGVMAPEFAADQRTNTLLVTASPEQLAEVDGLLTELDRRLGDERQPLRLVALRHAQPRQAADLLNRVVIGTDQALRAVTTIAPDDATGVLLVRAPPEVSAEIDRVLAEIDRPPTSEFKVRTILLERADANAVAGSLQRLYDDRARIASAGRGRREQARAVSIIGDPRTNTVLVAASDEDFEEIKALVTQFDSPQASQALSVRVFALEHAKASEIEQTVQSLVNDLTWSQEPMIFWGWWGGGRQGQEQRRQGTLAVRADTRLNALIVTGEGDRFSVIEELVEILDAPQPQGEQRLVRLYPLRHADVNVVAGVIRDTYSDASRQRRWWEPPDPTEIRVRSDERTKLLIVLGSAKQHQEIAGLVGSIDGQVAPESQEIAVLSVQFAQAPELARTLSAFLEDRAEALGAPPPDATIAASQSANTLIVSAGKDDLAVIRDLLARLDQPDVAGDRVVEIVALREADVDEVARIIDQQFGRRGGKGVIVTPDSRTRSLIVNAPREQYAQARALIDRLDAPTASDEVIIRTYSLSGARAEEAVRILSENLRLDEHGETKGVTIRLEDSDAAAVEVKAKIVADRRSNSLIVTATPVSFPVIETLISRLDEVPPQSPIEYRIVPLLHAPSIDVAFTLRQLLGAREDWTIRPEVDYNRFENTLVIGAAADQFEEIQRLISAIDQPSQKKRITEFVPLRFAQAQQVRDALSVFYGPSSIEADTPAKLNTRIVADPATNSLVVAAEESEWENIRALLRNLDSEEYDASLQLRVIPLTYADAGSVAAAINDAFAGEIARGRGRADQPARRGPAGGAGPEAERRDPQVPTVLVEAEEWVRASAEPQTNSVIVSASLKSIRKVEQIVAQLDVADYAKLPPPRIIPVTRGDAEVLARTLATLYERSESGRRGGRTGLRIVGDAASGTVVVRAPEEEFLQIRALAEALQDEASQQGLSVHVVQLRSAPAARVAAAIRGAFEAKAKETGQALAVEVDRQSNSLIVACTGPLLSEVQATVAQLDRLAPAAGQSIFIIELEHVSPEAASRVIETIGLNRPRDDDSAASLVTEPITVTPLQGRNAVVVVANPVDRDTIVGLLKALDSEPALAESQVRLVKLRNARAAALAEILRGIFTPGEQQADTPLARAVQEQVRRLAVEREGAEGPLRLDLTRPIKVIADPALNGLVISSTPANVEALAELVAMFDELPITDAVTVQIFPLQNIAAEQFARIVRDLFAQGKTLGQVTGTDLQGIPGGAVGRALLEELALSVDERTNTVVVAGKEDAVALVEVLSRRIDADVATGWVEPRVVQLRFADATDLAETLEAILVRGATDLAQSTPIQRQVARLRMARLPENGPAVLEADVFSPMTRLVIRPEPQLNALVLVGTPTNLEVVHELVRMLDVEAASPGSLVRIYPVEHASATRLAQTVQNLFEQQVASGGLRPDDRVAVQADERTNALVVTASARSFAILEPLLETLDAPMPPNLSAIQRIELANASAPRVAQVVQQMMDARLERLREIEPETADLERATVVADQRTNSLIVAAGNESFEVIRRLVEDLDRSTLGDAALVTVMPVSRSNAERIAETVHALMERRYAELPEEQRQRQMPLVLTDPRSNSLLVAAESEDCLAIRDLVQKLEEAPANPAIRLHVVPLETVRAEVLAPRVQTLMRQRHQSLGRAAQPSDDVSVEPDSASNSLVVACNDENIQVVRDLVETLLRAESEAAGAQVEIIQLSAASRAVEVAEMLEDLHVREVNRARGPGTVRLTPDERINALAVIAPPGEMGAIRRLATQLDGAKPTSVVEIKYVPLQSANALETVSLVETVLSGRGIGPRRTARQATVLRYLREFAVGQQGDGEGPFDEMQVSAAIRESISLTPDLRTNTVIVSAPAESIGMIERMIRDLDDSSTGAQSIRIFKLTNADALAMAEVLGELFNLQLEGNLFVLKPREDQEGAVLEGPPPPLPGQATYAGLLGTDLTAVPDARQQLSITVDSRTNSLLVSGTPTYLDLVEGVVQELDSIEANEREVFVYPLRNSQAAEVSRVVSEFVEKEQQKYVGTLSADQIGSAARLLEREITIVGDELSNTVLVSASPRYMERVRAMIGELDVDPPQVLIQVLLAEITLDATEEWGVNFTGSVQVDSATITGDYGLGRLGSAFLNALGVPSLSISTSDFELLVRALEAQGRLQVLSNPSVMAANNQPARIQVGENIGRPSSSRLSEGGVQQTDVEFQDIGVILEVTPSINPDGFVRMDIMPEITDLTNRTTQITENLEVPILTKRTATTTVTVKDGQTIVLGGLISDQFENRLRKVPLLGDIPWLGILFRNEFQESTTTELLIVLTPHVITSPTQTARVDALTGGEIDRLTLTEQEKESLRRSRLERVEHDSIYRDVAPEVERDE